MQYPRRLFKTLFPAKSLRRCESVYQMNSFQYGAEFYANLSIQFCCNFIHILYWPVKAEKTIHFFTIAVGAKKIVAIKRSTPSNNHKLLSFFLVNMVLGWICTFILLCVRRRVRSPLDITWKCLFHKVSSRNSSEKMILLLGHIASFFHVFGEKQHGKNEKCNLKLRVMGVRFFESSSSDFTWD